VSGGLVRVVLAVTALLVAMPACSADEVSSLPPGPGPGGGSPESTPPTTASAPSVPATTVSLTPVGRPSAADRAVLAGYQRFWESLASAYTTGDVSALREATVEPATSRYGRVAADLRSKGRTLQGPVSLAPLLVGRAADTVTLADCADLRKFRTYDRAGSPVFPEDRGLTTAEVRLRNVGGTWRVASFEERPSGCRRQGG
jgi:hypothetical protein